MIKKRKLSIKSYLYPYRVNFNFRIKDLNKSYKNQFFLIDEKVFDEYKLKKIISKDKFLLIKSNEKSKSFENLIRIINFLLKKNINRKDIIFAIGGGVIQDITGFVASILLRGIYAYGWEQPSHVQQTGILPVIEGNDSIIQAQSGTGKTDYGRYDPKPIQRGT